MEGMSFSWNHHDYEQVDDLRGNVLLTALEMEHFKSKVRATLKMQEDDMDEIIQLLTQKSGHEEEVQMLLNQCINNTPPATQISHDYDPLISPQQYLNLEEGSSTSTTTTFIHTNTNTVNNMIPYGIQEFKQQENMMLLDVLIQGRGLPQRGQFLKAVMDAGPLLQDMMIHGSRGPVPSWRNPLSGLGEIVHIPTTPAMKPWYQGPYSSHFVCKKQRLQ